MAAAVPRRSQSRTSAQYTDLDRRHLRRPEAFVHEPNALYGREQEGLGSLALASPRTTATQEGLAVFAEQITGNTDIERMKRVSLRIEAIARAREGAGFIDVFRQFLDAGQSTEEVFGSAQPVFRGRPLDGGRAFPKGAVHRSAGRGGGK